MLFPQAPCSEVPQWHFRFHRDRGFTLLELIVSMLIVAILVTVGVPSYKNVNSSSRIAAEINGLLGDVEFARSQAIKEGQTVTICSSANGLACAATPSWAAGWIVFMDFNGNKTVDVGESVLRSQKVIQGGDSLNADSNLSALTFNREGFALGVPGTATLTLHDPTGNSKLTRCLAVSIVGQLQTEQSGTGACL